jgi:predicted RND superfamily exporter protein
MTCNVGKTDKIVRVIIGLVIVALGFYFKSWWGLLAIIPLLTAAIGFCGLYVPFKISTIGKKQAGE